MPMSNDAIKHNAVLASFNCKSLKRSMEGVRSLCKGVDILALQETWLLPHDLSCLSQVDEEFGSTGTSAVDTSAGMLVGRPYGGVALLWRKSMFSCVCVIPCDNPRIAAIKISLCDRHVLIFSVYLPVDNANNLTEFSDCLGTISAIIEESSVESVFVLGDFNSHPGTLFFTELQSFCCDQEWLCVDVNKMSSDSYTFISEANGSRRWLDHCAVTKAALPLITSVHVKYDIYWSDHFPLLIKCNFDLIKLRLGKQCAQISNDVRWGERSSAQIAQFSNLCGNYLREIDFPVQLESCSGKFCTDTSHRVVIDELYSNIVHCLGLAAGSTHRQKPRYHNCVAGWNRHVRGAHGEARAKFIIWDWHGRPSSGILYENMTETRKVFKGKLKWCQNHQDAIKMDILASHHASSDFRSFWKCTNKMSAAQSLPVSVDGVTEPQLIAEVFKDHFMIRSPLGLAQRVIDAEAQTGPISTLITAKEVKIALKNMKRGKSPGHDGLSIEHLQHAGCHLPRVLALLFNLCVAHSHLPDSMMRTVVVPVIKNKTGDSSDRSNYRPISLATIIAKVLDSVLNVQLDKYISLHDAQFGFRPGLSTESAIVCLKHTVRYYADRSTPVYAAFLDLSKAFDLVSYDILWDKLKATGIPNELLNVFRYWYGNQTNVVRWGNTFSVPYRLECGVRQGGLSSPNLFNLYLNALIEGLSSAHVGCFVDGLCFNNISYADDMVLLAPSVCALRKLVKICEDYAAGHGLLYNVKKSELMVFKAVGKKCPVNVPPVKIYDVPIRRVHQFKYLGHFIADDLKDDSDVERERRALAVRANMLARRFARCTAAVKHTLFKAYCTSLYSSALWVGCTKRAVNALRVQYNNAFRVLMRLPRYCSASEMFAEARVDSFSAVVRKKSASLLARLRGSGNSLLKVIADRPDESPIMRHLIKTTLSVVVYKY